MRKVLAKICNALILGLLVGLPSSLAWRSFKIIFTRFDYEANANYLDVKIQIQNDSETSLNIVANTYENVDDVYLTAAVAIENDEGNLSELLNRTVNLCKMLKQRNAEPLIRIIYEDLLNHGNIFKECPIQKGSYSVHEYRLDEELLPSYLPETDFVVSIRLKTSKNVMLFSGKLYGRIDKSKGFNNLKMFSLG
ncbi:uncharacterized protein LOC115632838 [Scaptodrosophila lebanonensis]|uniref:Uncharacterized protein LOC115632838 n=1 Tax=Drosophila lebanonensis TaxID=7225 RepID=A0A6J2UC37_DROLE|nr:uncharacterized protein LOC115632838 [Scaptodrosophila lebanonensis]